MICPTCGGNGAASDGNGKCQKCKGFGWLNQYLWCGFDEKDMKCDHQMPVEDKGMKCKLPIDQQCIQSYCDGD